MYAIKEQNLKLREQRNQTAISTKINFLLRTNKRTRQQFHEMTQLPTKEQSTKFPAFRYRRQEEELKTGQTSTQVLVNNDRKCIIASVVYSVNLTYIASSTPV